MTTGAGPNKILLCDDDETLVDILESLFAEHGYTVGIAHTGFECLERITEDKPEVLILDIDMPDISGLKILEALAEGGVTGAPKVIVVSGHQQEDAKASAEALGAVGYIVKPLNCANLLERVNELVGRGEKTDAA